MNNQMETVKCKVCQSGNYETISSNGDRNFPINLVVCKNCGLAYLNPRWNKDSYLNYYKTEYDKQYRPKMSDNKNLSKPQTNIIIERIKSNKFFQSPPQNILEIGSGEGKNLIDLKKIFPDSNYYAIEPSIKSQEIIEQNGIELVSNDVDELWEENFKNHFDFIIMRHVLEHFSDPDLVLKKVYSTLKDSGILYIAVPNNLLTNRNKGWLRIVHTFYYNKNSLLNLLQKESFEPILLVEGDQYNPFELFTFCKKSQADNNVLEISQENYFRQRDVFKMVLKNEKNVFKKIKSKIIKKIKKHLPF